jgi:hypothetical protein
MCHTLWKFLTIRHIIADQMINHLRGQYSKLSLLLGKAAAIWWHTSEAVTPFKDVAKRNWFAT